MKKYCRKSGQIYLILIVILPESIFRQRQERRLAFADHKKDMVHYGPESAIGILGETGSVIWAEGLF